MDSDAPSERVNGDEDARLGAEETVRLVARALFLWLVHAGYAAVDGRVGGEAPPEARLAGEGPPGVCGANTMSTPSAEAEEWHRVVRASGTCGTRLTVLGRYDRVAAATSGA